MENVFHTANDIFHFLICHARIDRERNGRIGKTAGIRKLLVTTRVQRCKYRGPVQCGIVEARCNAMCGELFDEYITTDTNYPCIDADCVKLEVCICDRAHIRGHNPRQLSECLCVAPRNHMS